jgi:hypothetical protein
MNLSVRWIAALAASVVLGFVFLYLVFGSIGYNHSENYQVRQTIWGDLVVVDAPGYYLNWWARTSDYPRYVEYMYTHDARAQSPSDESIRVTFNDGGTAQVDAYVKLKLPVETEKRLEFHRIFRGSHGDSIRDAVEAHLINCVKAAGPIMSSTENQAARKSEFNQIIEQMLADGLFVMSQHVVTLEEAVIDNKPNKGTAEAVSGTAPAVVSQPIRVVATKIVTDPKTGQQLISTISPLKRYGMVIEQFSIMDTNYDAQTLEQFSAKKRSFLAAEQAKAEQQRAVQEKLKIRAEGESNVEQIKQEGEKAKMAALVKAEQEAEVAELVKTKAVTEALQKVEVAQQEKAEANTRKEIAAIDAERAELTKAAEISMAEGKQKTLEIGGGLSEEQKLLATLRKERDIGVAEALAQIKTPGVIISGGHEGAPGAGGEAGLQENLINLALLKSLGILDHSADTVFTPRAKAAGAK